VAGGSRGGAVATEPGKRGGGGGVTEKMKKLGENKLHGEE
jgi:hypothetical protein